MKFKINKFLLTSIVFVFTTMILNAQNNYFGFNGGLLNGGERVKVGDSSAGASDTGFYLGAMYEIGISEDLKIHSGIDYGNINDTSFGFLSARLKYYPIEKLFLQAGPQISYVFDELGDNLNKTGIDLSLGLGFDITDKFFIDARYSFELTNRVKSDLDITSKFRWLNVGIGFKL
ncbi:porin family protein [Cellulophaga sp. Z1A5H]|uniref:porin family protein n=1 Tax=Cellulophaga sp. Z1A5H TaxID=2687291 RepID=UPI0013FDC388|nr:porin family protein [Cellulophaga sp. Z1A5H]